MNKTLGGTVREARLRKGMTQKELADSVKRSRTFIADIESDRYAPGSLSLLRIATALGINHPRLIRLKQTDGSTAIEN